MHVYLAHQSNAKVQVTGIQMSFNTWYLHGLHASSFGNFKKTNISCQIGRYLIFFLCHTIYYQFNDEMSLTQNENLLILSLERPRGFWEKIHAKHFGRICKPFSFVKSHKKLCEQTLNQLWKIQKNQKSFLIFYLHFHIS